jgi:hypothetical protein
MALYFSTTDPERLLKAFKGLIIDGHVKTWDVDEDGDFTHTARQWDRRAWLRPVIENKRLALYILSPQGRWISTALYAIYHGRFIESMLVHCDALFVEAQATASPEGADAVGSPSDLVI